MADGEDRVDDGEAAGVVEEQDQAVAHHRQELEHLERERDGSFFGSRSGSNGRMIPARIPLKSGHFYPSSFQQQLSKNLLPAS